MSSIKVLDLKGNKINFSFPKTKKIAKVVLAKPTAFKAEALKNMQ